MSGYSLKSTPWGELTISATGTSDDEKKRFQKSLRKKIEKIPSYRVKVKTLGLAVLLSEIPTSEAEISFVDWISEVLQGGNNSFDFIYVISHRFCIYYDIRADYSRKREILSEENKLLWTIARMTAESELTLEDQEWQPESSSLRR